MKNEFTNEYLFGIWDHEDWKCELTMFNFLLIEWPFKLRAFGSWFKRDNEVILTYVHEGTRDQMFYIFKIVEIIDENTMKTLDVAANKIEVLKRQRENFFYSPFSNK